MKQKILLITSLVLNVALLANYIHLRSKSAALAQELEDSVTAPDSDIDSLVSAYGKRESELLQQTASLQAELNELKFVCEKKPQIIKIYKNEKNGNVSSFGSDYYNQLLSKRYENE
jgi:mannitol-1-phosphate/altronate dehydrogenase